MGRATGECGCIKAVMITKPAAWATSPTVRKGQYSRNHPAILWDLKVHQRLSWKLNRFATRKAIVAITWYQRMLNSVPGIASHTPSPSGIAALGQTTGNNFLHRMTTPMFTSTPRPPTIPKRKSCHRESRLLRSNLPIALMNHPDGLGSRWHLGHRKLLRLVNRRRTIGVAQRRHGWSSRP